MPPFVRRRVFWKRLGTKACRVRAGAAGPAAVHEKAARVDSSRAASVLVIDLVFLEFLADEHAGCRAGDEAHNGARARDDGTGGRAGQG